MLGIIKHFQLIAKQLPWFKTCRPQVKSKYINTFSLMDIICAKIEMHVFVVIFCQVCILFVSACLKVLY